MRARALILEMKFHDEARASAFIRGVITTARLTSAGRACNGRCRATRRVDIYSLFLFGGSLGSDDDEPGVVAWKYGVPWSTDGWTDIGSGILRGDAAWSTAALLRSFLSFLSPFLPRSLQSSRTFLSSSICCHLIPSRRAVLRPHLTPYVVALARTFSLLSSLIRSSWRTCLLEGPELADGHYGGYSAGFSRVSRKLTRECAPRGSRNSLGNRFTSFSASLYLSSFFSLPPISPPSPLLLSPPHAAANPPYAPSGSYLRVLLIFSYYRRGHVGTFHAYIRESSPVRTQGMVHLEVRRTPSLLLHYLSLFFSLPATFLFPILPPLSSSPRCSTGTPICEHIITGAGEKREGRGKSREGAKTR